MADLLDGKEFIKQLAATSLLPVQSGPDKVVVLFPGKAVTPVADRPPRRPPALKVYRRGENDYSLARR
jgi:hypothetical protein